MLLGRSHRHDERRPLQQALGDRAGGHVLQPPRVSLLSHRGRLWVLVVVAAGVAVAEWLRQPGGLWVWVAWISVGAEVALLWPVSGWRRRALLILLGGLATALTLGHRQIRAI